MIENFEYVGYWWIPENPKNRLYGTLKYIHNQNAVLEVMGNFQGHIDDPLMGLLQFSTGALIQPEIIHGVTVDGKLITLYQCQRITGNVTLPGIPTQSFKINIVFEGYYFKNSSDIKFKQISVQYSYLDEWVNISGFKRLVKDNKWENLAYQYDKPNEISLTKTEDYDIFIDFDYDHLLDGFGRELSIKQRSKLIIKALNGDFDFGEVYENIELIQDFLTFGVMETVYPLKINGEIEIAESEKKMVNVILCFLKIPDPVKITSTADMLFSYNEIKDNIGFTLKNWLNSANKIKYIYGLYFSSIYSPTYPENRFLNYIMAIEGYHRSMGKNEELSETEHKQRIKEILKAVNENCENHRQWLSGRLGHSNEPGLKKRLNDLLKEYKDVFGGEESFNAFINDSYEIRNKLVHPKGTEHTTVNEKELYNNTEMLKIAVSICLLNVLCFEIDDIKKIIPKMQKNLFRIP